MVIEENIERVEHLKQAMKLSGVNYRIAAHISGYSYGYIKLVLGLNTKMSLSFEKAMRESIKKYREIGKVKVEYEERS